MKARLRVLVSLEAQGVLVRGVDILARTAAFSRKEAMAWQLRAGR
ncbi:hypothetical protein [Streptomyces longwoodensis]